MTSRLAIALIALAAVACGGAGGGGNEGKADVCPVTPRPISVSVPNNWPLLDPEAYATEEERACAAAVYYEMFPWVDRTGLCDSSHPANCTNAYRNERRAHLHAMSAHKVKSIWSPENFNAYGPKHITDEAFRQHVREFREDAEEVGLEWTAMTSGGEPWAWEYARARARALIVEEEWPGELYIPDAGASEPTGQPYFGGISYSGLEVHPCSIEQAYRSLRHDGPILTVTDCGPVLVPGEPTLSELTDEAVRLDKPLLFYGFEDLVPNVDAMDAVHAAIVRGDG